MVCKKCESVSEQKLSTLAAPDPFQSTSSAIKAGTRAVGTKVKKTRFQPYQGKCKDCKQPVSQNKAKYCHGCAFKKGLCSICGKQILDTTGYSMSAK